jgi:UDP-N-acetylglucosamine:LPS N-acetylglucosamine transferase
MRVLLVASGGGHLHELLALKPWYERFEHQIITHETALSRSLANMHNIRFVPDIAFGLRRHMSPWALVRRACAHIAASVKLVRAFKPDVVISTGASLCVVPFGVAKLMGARTVYLESIARIHAPSLTGKIVAPWVDHLFVQWPHLKARWPRAHCCQTLRIAPAAQEDGRTGVFVSVGTAFGFPRLMRAVDALVASGAIPGPALAQIGPDPTSYGHLETNATLDHAHMQQQFSTARLVICHGGAGTILGALSAGCRVVVMPRRERADHVYDDHQLQIAKAFSDLGLVHVAETPEALQQAVTRALHAPRQIVHFDMSDVMNTLDQLFLAS